MWESKRRALMVTPEPEDEVSDLHYWSRLDLGKIEYDKPRSGPFRGLAVSRVRQIDLDIVQRRAFRDSVHRASTRRVRLDCLDCGACCRSNRVELLEEDIERFEDADRADLLRAPYARKDGKTIVLRLLKSRDCRHLGRDLKCAIYEIRPNACSEFPMGSECCLFAREDELDIIDGARRD